MELTDIAAQVKNKEDFVTFLKAFINDLTNNKEEWENVELSTYLEAMERFLDDSTDQSLNKIDFTSSWSLFARIMITATIYE